MSGTFRALEIKHPASARAARSRNATSSMPGTSARTTKWMPRILGYPAGVGAHVELGARIDRGGDGRVAIR